MTKYCEACHTPNRDRARICCGCAGRFSGVRFAANAFVPTAPAVPAAPMSAAFPKVPDVRTWGARSTVKQAVTTLALLPRTASSKLMRRGWLQLPARVNSSVARLLIALLATPGALFSWYWLHTANRSPMLESPPLKQEPAAAATLATSALLPVKSHLGEPAPPIAGRVLVQGQAPAPSGALDRVPAQVAPATPAATAVQALALMLVPMLCWCRGRRRRSRRSRQRRARGWWARHWRSRL